MFQVIDDHVTGKSVKELEIFKAKEDKALIRLWILAEKPIIPYGSLADHEIAHALHVGLWTGCSHAIRLRKYRGRHFPPSFLLYQLASNSTPAAKFALPILLNQLPLDLLMVNSNSVPESVKSSMDVSQFEVPEE